MAESLEEATALATPALRALLASGRPEQRVWALWALALRTRSIAGIADRMALDTSPGVRRTLAVMLAGHGETDLLVGLARHDPDLAVRESAMQLVTRLVASGLIDGAVVLDAARVDPPVRGAILAGVGRGAPAFLVELVRDVLATGTPELQAEAFEALLRTEAGEHVRAATAWMVGLDDVRAADAFRRMRRVLGDDALARELETAPRRLRALAIEQLHAPAWAMLERLIGNDHELLIQLARRNTVDIPIRTLAKAALDGVVTPLAERLHAQLAVLDGPDDELRALLFPLARHYDDWIAALDREVASPPARTLPAGGADRDDDDDDFDAFTWERAQARARLVEVRRQLRRLLQN